jgi:hypothetical protein
VQKRSVEKRFVPLLRADQNKRAVARVRIDPARNGRLRQVICQRSLCAAERDDGNFIAPARRRAGAGRRALRPHKAEQ